MTSPAETAEVRIVVLGNPLRGDDAAANRAVEGMANWAAARGAAVDVCPRLLPEWADRIRGDGRVVFVDAAATGPPGRVSCRPVAPALGMPRVGPHALGPVELLTLCRQAFGRSPEAAVVSVAGADFEPGRPLSPWVRNAIASLKERVRACAADRSACRRCPFHPWRSA